MDIWVAPMMSFGRTIYASSYISLYVFHLSEKVVTLFCVFVFVSVTYMDGTFSALQGCLLAAQFHEAVI